MADPMTPAELRFISYFDLADELANGEAGLELEDFADDYLAEARQAAQECGLPWPPHFPSAEDYHLRLLEMGYYI